MKKKNFNFAGMSEYQLENAGLRSGAVNVAQLISDELSSSIDKDALQRIRKNKKADQLFDEWLRENIDIEEAKLLRVFYGKSKLADIETLFDSDLAWNTEQENHERFEELISKIQKALEGGALYKNLIGS